MPKTLLLADDSVTIQKVVGISFANEDIVLLTVDNGDDAVARAREACPDIVLADVVMPGKNGYEVCQAIKAEPSLAHIPVLLLTGTFEAFDEQRAARVGADGHITKPFEAQSLVDKVNALLARPAAGAGAASGGEEARTEAKPLGVLRPARVAAPPPQPVSHTADTAYDFFDEEITAPRGPDEAPQDTTVVLSGAAATSSLDDAFALEDPEPAERAPLPPRAGGGALDAGFGADELDLGSSGSEEASLFDDFAPPAEPARSDERSWAAPEPEPPVAEIGWEEPAPAAPQAAWEAPAPRGDEPGGTFSFEPEREPEGSGAFDWDAGGERAAEPEPARADTPEWFAPAPPTGFDLGATSVAAAPSPADPDPLGALSAPAAEPRGGFGDFELEAGLGESAAYGTAVSDPDGAHDYDVSSSDLGPPLAAPPPAPAAEAPYFARPEPAPTSLFASPGSERERRELHDALEKLAWEAFGPVAENLVREAVERIERIAWEVIPQLAESLIKEEIRKLKGE